MKLKEISENELDYVCLLSEAIDIIRNDGRQKEADTIEKKMNKISRRKSTIVSYETDKSIN
jgi:hypothetical protein